MRRISRAVSESEARKSRVYFISERAFFIHQITHCSDFYTHPIFSEVLGILLTLLHRSLDLRGWEITTFLEFDALIL